MRIESQVVPQTLVESPKIIDKKELNANGSGKLEVEESRPSIPSPFGFNGVYSPSSLRAAVDYHAKFLTVAQNNLAAVNHSATIPQAIIDRLSGR